MLGFVGASGLPGVVLPLISQSILLWQITLSRFVLGKRLALAQASRSLNCHPSYTAAHLNWIGVSVEEQQDLRPIKLAAFHVGLNLAADHSLTTVAQIVGALLVAAGVCGAAWPGSSDAVSQVPCTSPPCRSSCRSCCDHPLY